MSDYEAGLLVREAELLLRLEPLLREAKQDRKDPENGDYDEAFYDGVIFAYKNAIAFIKGVKQMSIKRFDFVGWEEMDESPTGEFVRLEDIIEIIERCPRVDDDYMILCDARHLIALLKGEYK